MREPAQPESGFWYRLIGRGTPDDRPLRRASFARPGPRSQRVPFPPAAGYSAEGEQIATRLDVLPWLDATAMEGRLKTVCRSPRILHLATHCFYLPDQERDFNWEGQGLCFNFREFTSEGRTQPAF
jgi:hypothetical protein